MTVREGRVELLSQIGCHVSCDHTTTSTLSRRDETKTRYRSLKNINQLFCQSLSKPLHCPAEIKPLLTCLATTHHAFCSYCSFDFDYCPNLLIYINRLPWYTSLTITYLSVSLSLTWNSRPITPARRPRSRGTNALSPIS